MGCAFRSKPPKNVRHVDTSGLPQFTAIEERVIGINESRAVYAQFMKDMIDDVPVPFLEHAERLIGKYQRAIAKKATKRAILCDRGYSAGELPSKLKPKIIRQDYGHYTYNWFLTEYRTVPLSREGTARSRRYHRAKKTEKIQDYRRAICNESDDTDSGFISSHSIEYGFL